MGPWHQKVSKPQSIPKKCWSAVVLSLYSMFTFGANKKELCWKLVQLPHLLFIFFSKYPSHLQSVNFYKTHFSLLSGFYINVLSVRQCSACRCADVGRRGNRCCGGSVSELELPAHPHLQRQLGPRG